MAISNLGACEAFVVELRKSNLLERGQLDQVLGDFLREQPRPEPADLAKYLVHQGILTSFQADRVLKGKAGDMVLGPYVIMDSLGSGSMGTVFKAQSKTDRNWYAIKVLPRRSMWNVMVAKRMVRAYEQCKHPAVVPFMDVGTAGGNHYLVWPMVQGETLEHVVKRKGKLAPGLAAKYVAQVAAGLNACHLQKLQHGMIKPSNLLIGPEEQVYILDFGIGSLIASAEGESMIDTQSMASAQASGLDCVSPESIMEPTNLTAAGDQYSLGCVLYYCLTGRYPFPEESAVLKMVAHQTKQPTPLRELEPDTPEELAEIVERLMQKKPEDRYGSVAAIIEPLEKMAKNPAWAERITTPVRVVPTRQALRGAAAEPVPRVLPRAERAAPPRAVAVETPAVPSRAPAAPAVPRPTRPARRPFDERACLFLLKKSLLSPPSKSLLSETLDAFHRRLRSPFQKPAERVDCGVLAPAAVPAGSSFPLYVLVHRPTEARLARRLAREFGQRPDGGVRSLETTLHRGAPLTFHLAMEGLAIEHSTQHLTWLGWPELVHFHAAVPADRTPGSVFGTVTVQVDGLPLGQIDFTLAIVGAEEKPAADPVPLGAAARHYH